MPVTNSERAQDIRSFLGYLWDGLEGFVYLPTIERDASGARVNFTQQFFEWPENKELITQWVEKESQTKDVYAAPAIFSEPSSKKEAFKATKVVWVEFDGKIPEKLGEVPEPSVTIQSSDALHQHWYWTLDNGITEPSIAERVNRSLAYHLGADSSGWDINQILRVPGTYNYKHDKNDVHYLHSPGNDSSRAVSLGNFDALPPVEAPVIELENAPIPDTQDLVFKYAFPADVQKLFRASVHELADRSVALMNLGYLFAEMGMSNNEIFALIRNADDRWGKFKGRDDRNKRLSDIIAKVRIKVPVVVQLQESTPLFGFKSLLNSDIEVQWVIEGLLQEAGYLMLTGPPGVGKTQVALNFGIQMALGTTDYLGFTIARPQKIVMFSCEMGHADLKYFLSHMARKLTEEQLDLLEQNFVFLPLGESITLDTETGQRYAEEILAAEHPDGFLFDSLGSATDGDLSSEAAVKRLMAWNDSIRRRTGVWSWYIHHQRKANGDNKKPKALSDVYGSQYLVARATSVILLWPEDGALELSSLKVRLGKELKPRAITRTDDLTFMSRPILASAGKAPSVLNENAIKDRKPEAPGELLGGI